jgi:hypothetical protein
MRAPVYASTPPKINETQKSLSVSQTMEEVCSQMKMGHFMQLPTPMNTSWIYTTPYKKRGRGRGERGIRDVYT